MTSTATASTRCSRRGTSWATSAASTPPTPRRRPSPTRSRRWRTTVTMRLHPWTRTSMTSRTRSLTSTGGAAGSTSAPPTRRASTCSLTPCARYRANTYRSSASSSAATASSTRRRPRRTSSGRSLGATLWSRSRSCSTTRSRPRGPARQLRHAPPGARTARRSIPNQQCSAPSPLRASTRTDCTRDGRGARARCRLRRPRYKNNKCTSGGCGGRSDDENRSRLLYSAHDAP
eukprot:PRCOL_00001308-RA